MFSNLPFMFMFLGVMSMGTIFSVSSLHWLGIWAGLEINLIGFLPILVYQKSTSESESAMKYFIIQALGSSFIMFSSLINYSMSFSWEIYSSNTTFLLGSIFIFSGLFMKLGVFPFHLWFPSVMAGLPWITCLLLATWQKLAPLFLLLSLLECNNSYWLNIMLCMCSGGSALIGGLGGMNQTQMRALLAYSSIGHMGWMIFSMLHSEFIMKVYLSIYILMSICMFSSLWMMNLNVMKGLNSLKNYSINHFNVMLMLLSLGGLPPLLGFISKWLVVSISVTGPYLIYMIMLILGSLMSLFYYLSLFFSMSMISMKWYNLEMMHSWQTKTFSLFVMIFNILGGLLIFIFNSIYFY
uniref:NADH-ubiquinone oxidoreductase chain 2 n=1 Tax=Ficus variegata (in: gastropods) TaxID=1030158 RepID=A0A888QIP6_9CAEN|nr:NADH dehydrogenase subunit 2 [Ficus variegata Roding, 1798]QRB78547.1 NADH dehydrogenase subunit 2 [Ficus variegata Roding, 1798]